MKIPGMENINAANQIHNMLIAWGHVGELLYSEFNRFPRNVDRKKVAYKVTLVDKLYTCNLMVDLRRVVNHIVSLNIDSNLSAGNIQIVDKISRFPDKHILVFASKYCHSHQPEKFPIWDRFAAIGLGDLMGKDYWASRNYYEYKTSIDILNSTSGLQLSYRDIESTFGYTGRKSRNLGGHRRRSKT